MQRTFCRVETRDGVVPRARARCCRTEDDGDIVGGCQAEPAARSWTELSVRMLDAIREHRRASWWGTDDGRRGAGRDDVSEVSGFALLAVRPSGTGPVCSRTISGKGLMAALGVTRK